MDAESEKLKEAKEKVENEDGGNVGGMEDSKLDSKESLLTIKLTMACPQGELCAFRHGHIEGLSSVGDFVHFNKFCHFCPHFEERCPFTQKGCINHKRFLHPCKESTNCPYLFFLPQDADGVSRYNEHMSHFYHFCHMMGKCPLIQNAVHRAHFRHTPEMNISLHLPSFAAEPVMPQAIASRPSRDSVVNDPKGCDTCGKRAMFYDRLFCSHILCKECKDRNLTCAACMMIQTLLSEPAKLEQKACDTCHGNVQQYIVQNDCDHVACYKCLELWRECRPCERERQRVMAEERRAHS
jgi:hypothetical protein